MTHVQKETAVLLKEKGYKVLTMAEYIENYDKPYIYDGIGINQSIKSSEYFDTELACICIWLRAKGVHVSVVPVNLWQQWRMFIYVNSYPPQKSRIPEKPMDFPTHDLAIEAGIVHALKNYVK